MVKYIGSKRSLIPVILDAVAEAMGRIDGERTVIDLFSGTSRVGHALKRAGYRVLANDHNAYAEALARCYVQADAEDVLPDAERLVKEFNGLAGSPGYFTETFCVRSRFIQPRNGERIDAVREAIATKGLGPELEAVMLVSLMEAADRVDSTTGLQMAYLKDWSPRSGRELEMRLPEVLPRAAHGKGGAFGMDAQAAAAALEGDIAYIDPPYNQHSYLGNYHMWESLVRWDKPEVFGIACKRVDCKARRSDFNSRVRCGGAMRRVLEATRPPVLIVSFSNEGYIGREEMEGMLAAVAGDGGTVTTIENDYKRYVGAQIGIFSPTGEKVGKVSHLRNKEYLYVVVKGEAAQRSAERATAGVAIGASGTSDPTPTAD